MRDSDRSPPPWHSPPFYALEFADDAHLVAVSTAPDENGLVLFSRPETARRYAAALQDDDPDTGDLMLVRYDELSELHHALIGLRPEVRRILWDPLYPAETDDITEPDIVLDGLQKGDTVSAWHTPTTAPGKAVLIPSRR